MQRIICEPNRPGHPHLPTREDWDAWEPNEPAHRDEGTAVSIPDYNPRRREIVETSTIGPGRIPVFSRFRRRLTRPWTDSLV